MGGGGDTTNVTKTGLGDEQYEALAQNQSNISTQIEDTAQQSGEKLSKLSDQVGTRASQQSVDQGLAGVNQNIQQVGQQQQEGFANVGENLSSLSDQVSGVDQSVQQTGANLSSQIGGVGSAVNEGFGMTQDQLDRLSGQFAGFDETMTNQIDELGVDVGNRLNDLSGATQEGFQQASQQRQTGFAGLSDQLGSGFADAATQLSDAQSNIIGGQQQLNTMLEDTGNRLDTYYGGLAEGQQGIAQQVGGVQTGLQGFRQQYDQDTTLANQTRADIQQGLVNSTDMIRDDLQQGRAESSANQERLISAVGGTADAIREGQQQTRQDFGSLQDTVQGGFKASERQQLGQKINRVRQLLQSTGRNLDEQTRQQYSELVSAFDANGNLIEQSIDAQGQLVKRRFDDQGNLIASKFDQTGKQVGAVNLNVRRMLQQAALFEQGLIDRATGANVNMSQMTAPRQAEVGGFMTPYTQTR